jgi:outer membrane protein OmpA-like peptidoglycan-associated protein
MFSLSAASFRELHGGRHTAHRFVHYKAGETVYDLAGTLHRESTSRYRVIVNDRSVDLPVLEVQGAIGADASVHPHALVLDDERLPLLLDYGWGDYALRFTKISYPAASQLESQLDEERRVDVYGIYFDFASDRIRDESEPVLREIAGVMARNAAWTLAINGHTDKVGGDAFNQTLSRRRSDAVRNALIVRYHVEAERLSTSGSGASQPKATNDTIEGRAKNRRVELIRR